MKIPAVNFVSLKLMLAFLIVAFLVGCQEAAETAVPKLINDLNSRDSHTRNQAALKLGSYKEEADAAVPNLIYLLRDPNGGVRSSAAFALRSIKNKKGLDALDTYQK